LIYGWNEFYEDLIHKASIIADLKRTETIDSVYGVPRGGTPVAIAIAFQYGIPIVERPTDKSLIVDDYMDTGETLKKYLSPHKLVLVMTDYIKESESINALVYKPRIDNAPIFPWNNKKQNTAEGFETLCRGYGETREIYYDTMVKHWEVYLDGYGKEGKVKIEYLPTKNEKTLSITIDGWYVNEDIFMPEEFTTTIVAQLKPNKMPKVSDINFLVEVLSHRLVTPEDLSDSLYGYLKKHFKSLELTTKFHRKGYYEYSLTNGVKK